MFSFRLFFGLPLDPQFSSALEKVNPQQLACFIREGDEYLQKINHEGVGYLGRFVGKSTSLTELELLEGNIISLLKRLVPDHSYEGVSLVLISLPEEDVS